MVKPDGRYFEFVGGNPAEEYKARWAIPWTACGHSGEVDKGFRCDVGSTSIAERAGFPSVGDEMERAYGVHDFITRNPQKHPGITRRKGDKIMRKIGKQDGAGWWKRWTAWWFVRRFGKSAWRRHRD